MAIIDNYFNNLVADILENGQWQQPEDVRAKWDDGTPAPARNITDVQWKFDNSEILAPTTKKFDDVIAIREMSWIWIDKSNKVADLRAKNKSGKSIWDKWENKDPNSQWFGTIGPAYGYQLAKPVYPWKVSDVRFEHLKANTEYTFTKDPVTEEKYIVLDQVDNLIQTLLRSAGSRRILTTLWVPEDVKDMMITPCVWGTQWVRWNGKLNLTVYIRSNDICVGNPFNVYQYQMLQFMISQVTGIPIGTITFNITDAHIYDRHIDLASKQIKERISDVCSIWINPEITNFYDFTADDVRLVGKPRGINRYEYELSV